MMALTTRPEGAELILLPLAVALPQLAALAVEDDAGEPVASFAAVELDQDAPAVGLVVDVGQQVERLDDPAELLQCPRQPGRPIVRLKRAHQPAGLHEPQLQRAGQAQQIVPVLGDEACLDPVRRQLVEGAIVGRADRRARTGCRRCRRSAG